MKRIRTATFEAFLDNGEKATVTYTSEYVNTSSFINRLSSCIYKGVEIEPLFRYKGAEDTPLGIWKAIENNAEHLWNQKLETV